jgi:hypothetical protein
MLIVAWFVKRAWQADGWEGVVAEVGEESQPNKRLGASA